MALISDCVSYSGQTLGQSRTSADSTNRGSVTEQLRMLHTVLLLESGIQAVNLVVASSQLEEY